MSLKDVGKKYKVNKFEPDTKHYLDIYERELLSHPVDRMLEIGVQSGGSVKMWQEYFGCEVHGVDILQKCKKHETDNIKIFIGRQEDPQFIKTLPGQYDLIIDDGGHEMAQQQCTFFHMFKELNPGGCYVIEDLHTSYWPEFNGGYQTYGTTIECLKDLIDNLNWYAAKRSRRSSHRGAPVKFPDKEIDHINFYKSLCFIWKI